MDVQEVVYLKNGSVVRGVVIEQVPGVSLKVQTSDGSIFAYQMSEVVKITKESANYRNGNSMRLNNNSGNETGYKGFIDLGYTHSTIALNGFYNPLGKFDIHHPYTFDFPIDLDDDGIDLVDINGYLDDIYQKQGRSRDDSYVDIFGHTHRSQVNYPGSYCFVPSFFEGKSRRGACHLRIYFDEESDIKYMVFMPLIGNGNLIKVYEDIYQKILTK